jgi:hypothetical protein
MDDEFERIWKEVAVAYRDIIPEFASMDQEKSRKPVRILGFPAPDSNSVPH